MCVSPRTLPRAVPSLLAAALLIFASACAESKRPAAPPAAQNTPTTPTPETAAATPNPTPAAPPPELSEASPADLRDCVKRVYGDAVTLEEGRPDNYVTGDFNGDTSQDIAVVVRPRKGKLGEINDELANWILEDPREVEARSVEKASSKPSATPARVSVAQGDTLLAVIHGHKGEGWRNPAATQTYLLRNGAGAGLKTKARAEARLSLEGLTGDVISETLAREEGFLYWNGARYAWHSLTGQKAAGDSR